MKFLYFNQNDLIFAAINVVWIPIDVEHTVLLAFEVHVQKKKEIEKVRIRVRVKVIFANLYEKKFASLPRRKMNVFQESRNRTGSNPIYYI